MELLAKIYSTLGLTGQKGPAGSGDISSDEGESGSIDEIFKSLTHDVATPPIRRAARAVFKNICFIIICI